MIDVHSHILFGVDDGAKSMEETKQMLEMACQDGIEAIIVTPHYSTENEAREAIRKNYNNVVAWIEEMNLPIKLYMGNEALLDDQLIEELEHGRCLTLGGSNYVLIEFYRHTHVYTIKHILFQLCIKGYIPVIAHCERLIETKEDLKLILELKAMGCMLQVNASKITAPETRWQRKWISELIKDGSIRFIASDAHNNSTRPPKLKEAYNYIAKKMSPSLAQAVFVDNQEEIIKSGTC